MRFRSPWLLISLLFIFSVVSADDSETARDFSLPGPNGQVNLHEFQGKLIYLDFWASWCGPCRESFPWMNTLQQRFAKDGLVVIAINLDKDRALADQFITDMQPDFHLAFDPKGQVAEDYQVAVMPSSYLIDQTGKLVDRHLGFNASKRTAIEAEIVRLLPQHQ